MLRVNDGLEFIHQTKDVITSLFDSIPVSNSTIRALIVILVRSGSSSQKCSFRRESGHP